MGKMSGGANALDLLYKTKTQSEVIIGDQNLGTLYNH